MTDATSPIADIIQRFGGQNAAAKLLGCAQSSISEWIKHKRVPYVRIEQLIRLGKERDPQIILQPNDFFPAREVVREIAESVE